MDDIENNLAPDVALQKPVKTTKQKVTLVVIAFICLVIFVLVGVLLPSFRGKSSHEHLSLSSNTKDVIDEVLPIPKSPLPPVKERIVQYKQQMTGGDEQEDIVAIVESKQNEQETIAKAHLLARIESAKIKAQQQDKMNHSSVLSGLGVGMEKYTERTPDKSPVFDNGNTAFLAKMGSAPIKEEQAGMLGDLRYRITQGKVIKGVVDGAINSDLPDIVRAHVTEDVYGDQGDIILIPNGARLVGQYRSGKMKNGQNRVFIVWTRLIEPNGITVNLASAGSDGLGRAGMTGLVDKHSVERFGSAMLMSVISAGVSLYGVNDQDQFNSASQFRTGMSNSIGSMAKQDLQENIGIQPTIHIQQGTPLTIKVSHDISFEGVIEEMGVTL